mgnify:FL=1
MAQTMRSSLDAAGQQALLEAQMRVVARNFQELGKRLWSTRNMADKSIQLRHLTAEVDDLLERTNMADVLMSQIFGA